MKPSLDGSMASPTVRGGGLSMVEKERRLLEKLQQSQVIAENKLND